MKLVLCLAALILVGCSEAPAGNARTTKATRQAAAEAALSQTPVPRTYRLDSGELKVIEVPVKDGSGFVDSQRCFVYRDMEFKSASISCNQAPELLPADPHAEAR